ncbi:DUF551 domain-containing protein [Rodentibacter trehalosifermentans]|uniref:DUF551 domain-containing protein n=1 Tax=Rodentibacter trehalosifermentans TaxID=1908263 RepID=UPI000987714E|nr:DUF551 domain-containing protein [Rodentibacter trehalosifermentans]OOF52736.1 hypothetical protein BKK53_03845 [Rodentibacter trehalosifermentans]
MTKENNGWISVEDRLPSSQGAYLGYSPYWQQPCIIIEYDEDLGDFIEYGDEITHWQPLPEPPK